MGSADRAELDLLERIGGTRASVHRAVHRGSGRVVVVKRAPWDRPDVVGAIGREAAILGRVQHPALVRLLDVEEGPDGRRVVLAHAPGGSLVHRLATTGPLDAAEAAAVGGRIARALAALHAAGVTHRDVQPANVVFDAELLPVLVDLEHALDGDGPPLPVDDEVVGHPDHLDPRLLEGEPAGPASDLYGLGSTVWTAVTGQPPGDAPTEGHPMVPPRLAAVVTACRDGSIGDAEAAAVAFDAAALEATTFSPATTPARPPAPVDHVAAPPPDPAHRLDTAPTPGPSDLGTTAAASTGTVVPLRPAAVAGGGAGTSAHATRRYGPAPARPASVVAEPARRTGWLLLAALVVGLPVALLAALLVGDDAPGVDGDAGVVAPTACDGEVIDPDAVLADLGEGCSRAVSYSEGVLTLPSGRWQVGAPGDVLVAGDWDGDGRWTPGLYRPEDGSLFLFTGDGSDGELATLPPRQLAPGGDPVVVDRDGDGVHEVELTAPTEDA